MTFDDKFNNFSNISNDELDLNYLINLIYKNKKLISITTFIGIVLSAIISLSIKRIWKDSRAQ
tara:strand:- start:76 stop:264 length:189 start_codon:yes stop_codon:yes gene_type:complete